MGADPFRLDPFFCHPSCTRYNWGGVLCCAAHNTTEGTKSGVGRLRRPPPPLVWGWKYLHSMQRFWRGFGDFVKNDKIVKSPPKPLHGMEVGEGFGNFVIFDQNSLRV